MFVVGSLSAYEVLLEHDAVYVPECVCELEAACGYEFGTVPVAVSVFVTV